MQKEQVMKQVVSFGVVKLQVDKHSASDLEERKRIEKVLFQNGDDYVGKLLTVRYQELTDEGVPRFSGIAIRDYE